jgi:cytoskeleton protein RodZ
MMLEQEGIQPDLETQNEQSPGSILRAAREAKKITLIDAANELRLSPARLNDLEDNKFSEMGAITFAKGYLRSYARFLDISEAEVLQSFDEMNLGSDISSHKPSLMNEKMAGGSKAPRRMGYLVLLVIAVVAAFWWHNRETISQSFLEMTTFTNEDGSEAVSVTEDESPHSAILEESERHETPADGNANTYSVPVQGMSLLDTSSQSEYGIEPSSESEMTEVYN